MSANIPRSNQPLRILYTSPQVLNKPSNLLKGGSKVLEINMKIVSSENEGSSVVKPGKSPILFPFRNYPLLLTIPALSSPSVKSTAMLNVLIYTFFQRQFGSSIYAVSFILVDTRKII